MVNEWCSKIRKEGYVLDRQIRTIQREEEKVKRSMKDAAKRGDKDVCRVLAREVVQARRTIGRIYTSKAHLNSVQSQMKGQLATLRVAGSLQQSTEVMKAMQELVKLPEISKTMQELSREMCKAGIMEEMLEDTLDTMEPEEMEEEVQAEVDKNWEYWFVELQAECTSEECSEGEAEVLWHAGAVRDHRGAAWRGPGDGQRRPPHTGRRDSSRPGGGGRAAGGRYGGDADKTRGIAELSGGWVMAAVVGGVVMGVFVARRFL
ncbi:charged multivesicular body protein 3-like isoform X2 [Eriocheir sinensis]|uniref:charged multivesicular body protein 3-like isoform X2 n=1 Tax=Eriocheir sinensis TaxID=95602 RepID=UPI0021C5B651|nr:charged multivesicular body protein 3-like isoform X2 [Eriocheir sinensis]